MNIFCNEEHVKTSKYDFCVITCMIPEWDLNPYLLCLNDRVCNITPSGYLNMYTQSYYKLKPDTVVPLLKDTL